MIDRNQAIEAASELVYDQSGEPSAWCWNIATLVVDAVLALDKPTDGERLAQEARGVFVVNRSVPPPPGPNPNTPAERLRRKREAAREASDDHSR